MYRLALVAHHMVGWLASRLSCRSRRSSEDGGCNDGGRMAIAFEYRLSKPRGGDRHRRDIIKSLLQRSVSVGNPRGRKICRQMSSCPRWGNRFLKERLPSG